MVEFGLPDIYEEGFQEIQFEYTALAYFWENALIYRTRLIGYQENWSSPSTETQIRYTDLPAFLFPKTYTFEVEAGNKKGEWSHKPARYSFSVTPPAYLSWWAVLLYLLIPTVILWLLVRRRIQAQKIEIKKQQEINSRLEQLDQIKDQFLANTSHELRTPLNGIIGITEALFEDAKGDEERQNLGMVIASGKRLASLVDDLLDFSRIKNAYLEMINKN